MVRLIVRQQHIPKVPFQVLLPHLLIAVDGSGPLVGMYPGHIHTIHEVNDGEHMLRPYGTSVGVHCGHVLLAFTFDVTWWILTSCSLLAQAVSDSLAFNRAASVAALPVRDVPLAGAKDDGSVLLASHALPDRKSTR